MTPRTSYSTVRWAPTAQNARSPDSRACLKQRGVLAMSSIIYIIGLVVVVVAVLSFFGLR
ncbi:MAG: hypothetical protein EOP81_02020 [Variovorax sp.]|nr:MAG: hypothetical protein EOP81_02020 [Variovorax sp.]